MLDSKTKRRIDDARDILVGKIPDPKSQVEQITIALIYKFMDDMDVESEEFGGEAKFFVGEYKKYSWRRVFNKTRGGQEILLDYREALQKLSENPELPSIFHTIFRQAYLPYNDPETLKEFLKIIDKFSYDHSEELGDAFEYLLSVLGSQGDAGQFRTPRHIIDFMVEIVQPKKNETILDPACGTAGFLISAYKHILRSNSSDDKDRGDKLTPDERKALSSNINGYDISPDMVRLSLVNMYLHSITEPKITEYDTLTSDTKWNEYFDVILANPPFMSPKGGIKPHSRFSVQSKRSEALFIDYIAEHLTTVGRGAVIVPEGVIFKSDTAFTKLRKMLIDDHYLYGVVSLPAGIFNPYSGVKTSILLFDKPLARLTDKILFAKINNEGFDLGAQRRPNDRSELPVFLAEILDFRTKTFRKQEFTPTLCTLVEKAKIAESGDYNLSGDIYEITNKKESTYDIVKLSEICYFSRGITFTKQDQLDEATTETIKVATTKASQNWGIDEEHLYNIPKVLLNNEDLLLRENDILISLANSLKLVGRVSLVPKFEYEVSFGAFMGLIRPKQNVLAKYLYYQLCTPQAKRFFQTNARTTTNISNIGFASLNNLEIPLPSLEEQKAIVAEIESYQKIIEAARTIVDNYRPQIIIDPTWPMVELGIACEVNPLKSEIAEIDFETHISFVPMADINENDVFFVSKEVRTLKEVYSGYTYFKNNDVLLAKVTPCFENGKAGIAKNLKNGIGFGSSEFYVLRAKPTILPMWIYMCVQSPAFKTQGKTSMTGTGGLQRIPKQFILKWNIPLPNLATQEKIVAEVEKEQKAVNSAKQLIEIFEQKISDRIARIWGE